MTNIFSAEGAQAIISRLNQLTSNSQPLWGKMSVDKMLAHCNVAYQFTYEPERFKKPNFLMRFILKNFIKKIIVSETPFKKNMRTAPEFLIADERNFEKEKTSLINNIQKTQQLGTGHFDGLENFSFGKLTAAEWNNLFSKHLEHHLQQFGV